MSVDLRDYYANLLIIQYHNKGRAKQEIALGSQTFAGDWLLTEIPEMVDVDKAVGAQLDLIGKIVGVDRQANGFTYGTIFFAYDDYEKPLGESSKGRGFSDIDKINYAPFKDYENVYSAMYTIFDGNYRSMIKLKILSNNSDGSLKSIDEGLYQIFGDSIKMVDNFDMTCTIYVDESAALNGRLADFLNLFTRPLGVGLNIVYE